MKSIKTIFTIFITGFMMASCSNEAQSPISPDAPVEVKFTSGMTVQARAYDNLWESGDAIGIYMIKAGNSLSDLTIKEGAKNRIYKIETPNFGAFTADASNKIYYPVDGSAVDFIAYYPQSALITQDYLYPINTAMQSSQKEIDLLYSSNATNHDKTPAKQNVTLEFDHILAKVTFTLIAGEGLTQSDVEKTDITLKDLLLDGTFSLANKAITLATTSGEITPLKTAVNVAEAIIIPQATSGKIIEFNISGDPFKWTIDENWESGKKYNYNVTINRTGVAITTTITDWSVENRDISAE